MSRIRRGTVLALDIAKIERTPQQKFEDLIVEIFCVFAEMGKTRISPKEQNKLQKAFRLIADAATSFTGMDFFPDIVSGRYRELGLAISAAVRCGACEWALPSGGLLLELPIAQRARILADKEVRRRAEILAWAWLDGVDDSRMYECWLPAEESPSSSD